MRPGMQTRARDSHQALGERMRAVMSAAVAIELYAQAARLCSLVVTPTERGQGLGIALVRHAEASAGSRDVRSMYLLTLSAEPFLQRLGYTRLNRSEAPTSIRRTSEFASLCPPNSAFMVKAV
jgi:amino-acid N-acetyltransferase